MDTVIIAPRYKYRNVQIILFIVILGDPDDKSLRKVELEICIPRLMKNIAHNEKCPAEVKGQ